ncbi:MULTISPECIES: heparan-alpha-glucosaminide N-acetyltransferase domain-containing protein [Bacteria]|uniref:heparan-alpha-glucosaminide N-acetyltransferase domain-containing protein n=1 Tax=Bacteria TaxID=2 RepID=UPI003C7E01BB
MTRLLGLDLFRAVAVFGMLVAHVGPNAWAPGDGGGTVLWQWEVFHSRMPAMFAFAAGLSLTLGSRPSTAGARAPIAPMLVRAALLALIGGLLTALGTPAVVILASFAVWFVLVIPFLRMGLRGLLITAATWAVGGPLLSFVLRRAFPEAGGLVWTGLVGGDYPTLTWMPFVLAGLAVGRLDLSSPRVRIRLAAVGAGIAALAYGGSALFLALGGRELLLRAVTPSGGRDAVQEAARIFFRESGVTDTGSWLWLLVPGPHSGSWTDVFGCLGVSALLLAVLLPLGDWAARRTGRAQELLRVPVRAVATMGAMVLSVYAAHIVGMAAITALTGHSFRPGQSEGMLFGFTAALLLFSVVWLRSFRRGPLEELLARASALTARTGRRASGGSSRR